MNKNDAHLYLPLVQALMDGKTLQVKNMDGVWMTLNSGVSFDCAPERYRVKPEPKIVWYVLYVTKNCHERERLENPAGGADMDGPYLDKEFARARAKRNSPPVGRYALIPVEIEEGTGRPIFLFDKSEQIG